MLSEERLRQAAHHAAQALEDSLPPPSQCHYDVSPEFRRNMKKLCRQAKRRPGPDPRQHVLPWPKRPGQRSLLRLGHADHPERQPLLLLRQL